MSAPDELPRAVRTSWHGFLETIEPLRIELYRYCRQLTRSPWDAEDLAQDTLARAFVTLGQMGGAPPNPRAWLFRVASNLWIDRMRRARREQPMAEEVGALATEPRSAREAAGTLLGQLSPQERAAVVLKDVFDLSLEEVADALTTTVGAVKTALHRGRGKLVEAPVDEARAPAPAVLDAFCAAFNAGDIDRLTALLLDNATVEVVGATTKYGQEAARRTVLWGMLFGVKRMVDADASGSIDPSFFRTVVARAPRVEARAHRGSWILVHWYAHDDGEAVRAFTRIDADGDRVARLQNYFFNPELIAEVAGELTPVAPERPPLVALPQLNRAPEDIMSLTLYFHPLSSFCQKVLIGLYEHDVPFTKRHVDSVGKDADRAALLALWPIGKFPVLHDAARDVALPESSIILEYLDQRARAPRLIPADPDRARACRLRDRFFDLYIDTPLGKIVTDKLRPEGKHDPYGVEQTRAQLETAYTVADEWVRGGPWAIGDAFTMADCAAAPALFFAKKVVPFGERRAHLDRYFARLAERPSVARAFDEAKPYLAMFPG